MNIYEKKEGQGLDKYKGKGKSNGYISLLFLSVQKGSNRLTYLNNRPKNLNYLIYIPKMG